MHEDPRLPPARQTPPPTPYPGPAPLSPGEERLLRDLEASWGGPDRPYCLDAVRVAGETHVCLLPEGHDGPHRHELEWGEDDVLTFPDPELN